MTDPHQATPCEYLDLGDEEAAFARGGNRLCFVDPRDANRCVKVLRADRLPAIKRAEKGFPKNLKSVDSFDDNYQECRVYQRIQRSVGLGRLGRSPNKRERLGSSVPSPAW